MLRLLALLLLPLPALADPAVGRLNLSGYKHREMCSGTLIAPDKVLTAAHCVATVQDGYLKRLGDMTFVADWNGESHKGAAKLRAVQVHPKAFTDGRFDLSHDIAVVELAQPLQPTPHPLGDKGLPGPLTLIGYQRSAPHRQAETGYCYGAPEGPLWRIACRVEPGQSGGPVLNDAGEIVAVISAVQEEQALVVPVDEWLREQLRR
ncbi:trypsin-like serine peptidase [Tropicibacter naphthalenivorans]|uniref:V8-like Glu-specific endopeptidase n=1 Tax=Tropicibacter naphthalenivorans TaxID=441103 RepID=A0A0N7LZ51_9RHOB|nr:trypsin-like peptidase domain-containing protein [Tropicibacter naphthalenivorans]CUH76689.1 V8-like Glu-specific endopeptidase [Tropicibacter naphthalenivorans]SMC63862.1 Trypsin-like peptidase domain-containing protein [Tropicibacter naphthalenivorans]